MDKDKKQNLKELKYLVDTDQISPESFLAIIKEMITTENGQIRGDGDSVDVQTPDNDIPDEVTDDLPDVFSGGIPLNHDSIDRQSLSVQIKQIDGSRTTIKDEEISHTENGGLHSDVVKAIIISCEGKKIDANNAQGICEITGKLAQKALSCHLCHRSICLRHCEFIQQNGENYPYCNTPIPGSKISCARKVYLSMNTWQEAEKKTNKEKTNGNSG
ncbi:MAG: hypothetical protein WBB67_04515 [bacterium]